MNERILALAEQATKEVWGNNPHNGAPEFEGYELDQEKFAELIQQDCLQHLTNTGQDHAREILERYFAGR